MGEGKYPITLFGGGSAGYGHARNTGQDGYHWAYGFDCRHGRAMPVAGPSNLSMSLGLWQLRPYGFEWPKGHSSKYPLILLLGGGFNAGTAGAGVFELRGDTVNLSDIPYGRAAYTGGTLYRNGDTEMAYFCNGSSEDALRVRNAAGTYSDATSAKADQLAAISSDLWRVVDKYKLEKLTIDTDPGTEGNWSGIQTPAGSPAYPVNKVLELGGAPIPLSGLGVFKYNSALLPDRDGAHPRGDIRLGVAASTPTFPLDRPRYPVGYHRCDDGGRGEHLRRHPAGKH
jgi:hypothetical protein